MRFIHTADWHLGRYFHGMHLTEEQADLIEHQLMPLIEEERAEAVVIAGDIYDRGVPPVEAVELFDEFLAQMKERRVKVLFIAGNHDSEGRLDFASRLMQEAVIFARGRLHRSLTPVILADDYGPLAFQLYPYMDPQSVRAALPEEAETSLDFETAHEVAVAAGLATIPKGMRSVAVAHAFLAGGVASESERPLAVGGSSCVRPALFRPFCYTALGHLHNPQRAGDDTIRYSGSLMKYSFDEAEQRKGVLSVEIDGQGQAAATFLPLVPRRDVRRIRGTFAEIRDNRERYPSSDDYMEVVLLDTGIILDVFNKLKVIYPNLMHIRYPGLQREGTMRQQQGQKLLKMTEGDLFAQYYEDMMGEALAAEQRELVSSCLQEIYQEERER